MRIAVLALLLVVFSGLSTLSASDTLTIYDIQYTTDPSGDSPYEGDTVTTFGVVTGTYTNTGVKGFSLEEQPGGAWHGVFVYTGGTPSVEEGDSVRVTAVVTEFYGRTELSDVIEITTLKHNAGLIGPTLLSTGEAPQEKYEGVFLRVENAVCESLPNQYNEWWVNDGTGPLMIDDLGVTFSPQLGSRYNIQGFLDYSYQNYKLEPRVLSDIEEITGNIPPEIEEVTYTPPLPDRGDYVTVKAVITDDNLVQAESLFFSIDSMMSWIREGADSISGDTFFFVIDPQPVGTDLFFYVFAMDDSGAITVSDTFFIPYLDFTEILPIGYLHILDDQGLSIFNGMSGIKVQGVVTVAGELGLTYYIQDTTGGVALYDISGFMKRGDTVLITGYVDNFYGLVEIKNGSVLERKPGEEPEPLQKTCYELTSGGEAFEGMLVRIGGVTTDEPILSGAITINDETGSFTIYIDNDSELYGLSAPSGKFNVTGVVSQHVTEPPYFGGYQIVPRTSSDIVASGNGSGNLELNPAYILQGETIDITLKVRAGLDTIRALQVVLPEELDWSYSPEDISLYGNFEGAVVGISKPSGCITLSSFQVWDDSFALRGVSLSDSFWGAYEISFKTSTTGNIADLKKIIGRPVIWAAIPIENVQEPGPDGYGSHMEGDSVVIAGVVTGPSETFSPSGMTSLWIQDRTGGVNVFFSGATLPYELGDLLAVKGSVTEYNGVTEITVADEIDLNTIGSNYPQPEPVQLRVSEDLREDLEGKLLKFQGQVGSPPAQQGSGKAFQLWNGQVPINLYVYDNSGIDLSQIQVGQRVELQGICGQYDTEPPYTTGYQFLPRISEDITILEPPTSQPEPTLELFVLSGTSKSKKKIFAPSLGEVMELSASGPLNSRFTLRIFDSKGRKARTFYENTGSPFVVQWKGKDDIGRDLPLGMYIVQLRAKLPSGEEKVKNSLVVIAAKLK